MQLVLDTTGLSLGVRNGCFYISREEEHRQISPERITSIHITAPVSISSAALLLAVAHGIPVVLSDHSGHATLRSAAYANLPQYRRWQLRHSESPDALSYTCRLLSQKSEAQWQLMQDWRACATSDAAAYVRLLGQMRSACNAFDALAALPPAALSKEGLRAAEATAAQHYWDAVALLLPPEAGFTARQHRPALDPFNAALNYWYGMLYQSVEAAIYCTGLDAACGLLHAEDYNIPALCYDLIEPFRPGADAALLRLCTEGRLTPEHVIAMESGGLWLSKAGKALIIPAYHDWMQEKIMMNGRLTQRKNHILQSPAMLLRRIRELYEG